MPTRTIAILGASGFIGSRLVEWLVLNNLAEVRPIVRSFRGMARLARFAIDCRLADATDQQALETQLRGCTHVFHCVTGDSTTILRSVEATYRAMARVGARRLVYLSSAVVHGTDPPPGTHDESDLLADQPFEYNVSKVKAEYLLRRLRTDHAVEVVTLRPCIVFGPRSTNWTVRIANQLLRGQAYLVDGGSGICNTVYVDNLIQAMWQACISDSSANEDFLITDGENVTWLELYASVAHPLHVDGSKIRSLDQSILDVIRVGTRERATRAVGRQLKSIARQSLPPMVTHALQRLGAKEAVERLWKGLVAQGSGSPVARADGRKLPSIDPLLASLQDCRYVLPIHKARRVLGYEPAVPFAEACRKTESWLRLAFPMELRDPTVVTRERIRWVVIDAD